MPAVADCQVLGMAAISNDAGIKDAGKPSFWKKNKTVPGRYENEMSNSNANLFQQVRSDSFVIYF